MNDPTSTFQPYSILDRLKEPSTWSALAAAAGTAGWTMPAGMSQNVALIGTAGATLLGILLREKKR